MAQMVPDYRGTTVLVLQYCKAVFGKPVLLVIQNDRGSAPYPAIVLKCLEWAERISVLSDDWVLP